MSSTAIFGGAQVVNILVNIVRGKLVSMILHTVGMGVQSLYVSAANTVQQFAILGLNISAVRNISQANDGNDERALAFTVRLVRSMMFISALLGFVIMVVMSPFLSKFSFGDRNFTISFALLGLLVVFNILGTGETTILQGMRRYKQLAFCSVVPPLAGLLFSIPIYYIWRLDGIVPAMILVSVIYYVVLRFYSYHNPYPKKKRERLTLKRIWVTGHEMIQLGIVMTIGVLLGTITTYLIVAFINKHGNIGDVGLYQAGNTITSQYIGLIFTAMAADFYPHLSSLIKTNKHEAFRLVNQQAEIALLFVTPLSMIMTLTAPILITVLLTSEFLEIRNMIRFMALGCIFKAMCFPMDYIAYAKGDKKYILWIETLLGCTERLSVMTLSYYYFGLDGLGYGALVCGIIDFIVSVVAIGWRYGFKLSGKTIRLMIVLLALATSCVLCSFFIPRPWGWYVMTLLNVVGCAYSLIELNKRLQLRSMIDRWKNRKNEQTNAV